MFIRLNLCFRFFTKIPVSVPYRIKHSPEELKILYDEIELNSCEIFDEEPTSPDKPVSRDGGKYLNAKSFLQEYLSYFPLHQNELLYPLRTKYSTIVPIKKDDNENQKKTILSTILPPSSKTYFSDIDKTKNLLTEEEKDSLLTLEEALRSGDITLKSSKEMNSAFHFIPPEADSVYKFNARERKRIRGKLPPARSRVKTVKTTKK